MSLNKFILDNKFKNDIINNNTEDKKSKSFSFIQFQNTSNENLNPFHYSDTNSIENSNKKI